MNARNKRHSARSIPRRLGKRAPTSVNSKHHEPRIAALAHNHPSDSMITTMICVCIENFRGTHAQCWPSLHTHTLNTIVVLSENVECVAARSITSVSLTHHAVTTATRAASAGTAAIAPRLDACHNLCDICYKKRSCVPQTQSWPCLRAGQFV